MTLKEYRAGLNKRKTGQITKSEWKKLCRKHAREKRKARGEVVRPKFRNVERLSSARITENHEQTVAEFENRAPKKAEFASMLKGKMTKTEKLFWDEWQARKFIGLVPQPPLYGYIPDFVAFGTKTIVEFDGSSHEGKESYDAQRTKHLKARGFKVVRFTNEEVQSDLNGVIEKVKSIVGIRPIKEKKEPRKTYR
ncbi:MAG TPA: endonuclease domain-containing protein [Leptospiraceae bacterium]|nr:endonuclease domain-containing protein [Leptospiraceae bacterium]